MIASCLRDDELLRNTRACARVPVDIVLLMVLEASHCETCPYRPNRLGGCMVSRFTTWSTAAAWFPDSPRCEHVPQADCAGGVPIAAASAELHGTMGAADGGGGMRVLAARGCVCSVELA